ncbi:MAG: hypothetical protein HKN79_03290 [Flavobacteriales bacterium]|nr:hypothetical protein [Flavobacteriales bacterium]
MSKILDIENERYASEPDMEIIYSFVGPLNHDRIHEITQSVESSLIEKGVSKGTVKKTFTILIEGLQNAYIHGKESERDKYLGLSVIRTGEIVNITILGLTDTSNFHKVSELVGELNEMDKGDIKAHYLEVMTNGQMSAKGGAGLGLITMVMKSTTGIELDCHPIEEENYIIASRMRV